MTKTFSTKLDVKVLKDLNSFCQRYHLKKSSLLEEIIGEGIKKKGEAMELAASIAKGLEEEKTGSLYTADEVEATIFGKKAV